MYRDVYKKAWSRSYKLKSHDVSFDIGELHVETTGEGATAKVLKHEACAFETAHRPSYEHSAGLLILGLFADLGDCPPLY